MRLRYTATARTEIADILTTIASENPEAAERVASAIKSAAARLLRFPLIGRRTDMTDVRVKLARPYHHLIFYSVERETVVIRNVRHPAQRRPKADR